MEKETKQKYIEHPMEEILDIEPGTTLIEYQETPIVEAIIPVNYDDKDKEIDDKLETIYTTAMDAATDLADEIERVEGKYKARMGEVSATMLNVALAAVREKAAVKMHKDKSIPSSKPGAVNGDYTVNNNLIVADRNEVLRAFLNRKPEAKSETE